MAREKNETPQHTITEYDFKLSDRAKRTPYKAVIDNHAIEIYPDSYEERKTADGRTFRANETPANTRVTNLETREVVKCEGGFKFLTPQQVWELVSAGLIILSRSRKSHFQTVRDYLTNNIPVTSYEDY